MEEEAVVGWAVPTEQDAMMGNCWARPPYMSRRRRSIGPTRRPSMCNNWSSASRLLWARAPCAPKLPGGCSGNSNSIGPVRRESLNA